MKRWRLIIDVEKCEDCNNCLLACKDEHVGNEWEGYAAAQPKHGQRWMDVLRKERGAYPHVDVAYRPTTCMHCEDAPCVEAAPDAVRKRPDGIVLIDPLQARGRRELARSCPYGMIWWNEELEVPQKCTLCAHLLDAGWKEPRCVQSCPTAALRLEKLTDEALEARARAEGLEALRPELGTKPAVYYKNLFRFDRCFIAGSVAYAHDGRHDCARGARVVLSRGGETVAEASADAFGDFKFDRLDPQSGGYQVTVSLEGYRAESVGVELGGSQSLGILLLKPAGS